MMSTYEVADSLYTRRKEYPALLVMMGWSAQGAGGAYDVFI